MRIPSLNSQLKGREDVIQSSAIDSLQLQDLLLSESSKGDPASQEPVTSNTIMFAIQLYYPALPSRFFGMQETQLIDIHVNTRAPKHWIRTKQDSILAIAKRAVARLWLRVQDQRREWLQLSFSEAVLPVTFPVIHAMPLLLGEVVLFLGEYRLNLQSFKSTFASSICHGDLKSCDRTPEASHRSQPWLSFCLLFNFWSW